MRMKVGLVIVLALLVLSFVPSRSSAECFFNRNSTAVDLNLPDGPACEGTGPGCTVCYTPSGTDSNQGRVCAWSSPDHVYCMYFTDNRIW